MNWKLISWQEQLKNSKEITIPELCELLLEILQELNRLNNPHRSLE